MRAFLTLAIVAAVGLMAPTSFAAESDTTIPVPKLRKDVSKKQAMVSVTYDVYGPDNPLKLSLDLLAKYELPATFFLTTGAVGDEGSLTWKELRSFVELGHEAASRGHVNNNMTDMADDQIAASIARSAWHIARDVGVFPTTFTAPWNAGDQRTASAARALGLMNVTTDDYGTVLGVGQNDLAGLGPGGVSRVMLTNETTPDAVCDQVAWAANDHRWLVIGVTKVVVAPVENSEWYDIPIANLDLIYDCIATYAKAGVIKPVTLSEGIKAVGIKTPTSLAATE